MIDPMPTYRLRYMNTQAWLLAPHASSALSRRSEDDVYQMLNSITTGHLSFDALKLVNNAKVFRGNVDKDVQMLM